MKVYEKLTINIVDVKVLIDWQSPVLEVLLWFWGISGSNFIFNWYAHLVQ